MPVKPYLSIVVTTRNDNHGGDLLARTRCFVEGLLFQTAKFKVSAELIVVEWNPPAGKPLLQEVLPKPGNDDLLSIRYIIIPKEIHQTYRFNKSIPLYQMIAKNVGIRRASGQFVLCTNIDLLFSDDCFRFFAKKNLRKNCFYRANRCDIPKEVLQIKDVGQQLRFAEKNITKRLGLTSSYKHPDLYPAFFFWFPNVLGLLDRTVNALLPKKRKINARNIKFFDRRFLDMMACGDFTLMSKEDWFRIKGYCELDMYSLHVDSMALISALAIGMEQYIFPKSACSYHIYHEDGWESNYKSPNDLLRFLVARPALDWHTVMTAGRKLLQQGKPFELNDDNWGFADRQLEAFTFSPHLSTNTKIV